MTGHRSFELLRLYTLLGSIRLFLPNIAQMLDEMKVEREQSGIGWTSYNQEQREALTRYMRRIDSLPAQGTPTQRAETTGSVGDGIRRLPAQNEMAVNKLIILGCVPLILWAMWIAASEPLCFGRCLRPACSSSTEPSCTVSALRVSPAIAKGEAQ